MTKETSEIAIRSGERGLELAGLDQWWRFAKMVAQSGIAPKGEDVATILVKMQAGREMGLEFIQSLNSLVVINGRVSLMGEAALAICRRSGLFKTLDVGVVDDGDASYGYVEFEREHAKGRVTFSVKDAKKAALWGKSGPWSQYPQDMLIWKAVSRFAKRYASDVLRGNEVAETAPDISRSRGDSQEAAVPVRALRETPTEMTKEAEDDPLFAVTTDPRGSDRDGDDGDRGLFDEN